MNVPKTMASRNVSRLESFARAGLLILQTAFVLSVISPVVPAVPVLLLPVVMLMSYLWIIGMSVPEHRDIWTDVMERPLHHVALLILSLPGALYLLVFAPLDAHHDHPEEAHYAAGVDADAVRRDQVRRAAAERERERIHAHGHHGHTQHHLHHSRHHPGATTHDSAVPREYPAHPEATHPDGDDSAESHEAAEGAGGAGGPEEEPDWLGGDALYDEPPPRQRAPEETISGRVAAVSPTKEGLQLLVLAPPRAPCMTLALLSRRAPRAVNKVKPAVCDPTCMQVLQTRAPSAFAPPRTSVRAVELAAAFALGHEEGESAAELQVEWQQWQ